VSGSRAGSEWAKVRKPTGSVHKLRHSQHAKSERARIHDVRRLWFPSSLGTEKVENCPTTELDKKRPE
jgi:hypothetical protein